ncbi:MAG: hypothetical protein KJ799_18805, partial [Bacteroidetes bacterium]|nr:hypothetical protein [Bacteroidota bacterium]
MYFNWINILLLIAAAQSVFLAVFFFHKYSNSTANRFFALVMFSYAVVLIYMLLWDKEVFLVFPKLMIATTGTAFLVGPLYYLY